jgi:hypothetical protein
LDSTHKEFGMLARKPAAVLFLSFLMLSGLAAAVKSDPFIGREQGLPATNLDLTLPGSLPTAFESEITGGITFSNSFSQPGTWTLSILVEGMEGYVLTAVVTETGNSGFRGVSLQSTTATQEGYFGGPIMLASNPVPTSFVAEPSTANLMFTGLLLAVGMAHRRVVAP